MLQSGVIIHKAVATAGRKVGDANCRRILAEVADNLHSGDDLTRALERRGDYFPRLFIDMVSVGERTGSLAEVLNSLADHYDNLVRLRRSFIGAITPSLLQFLAAVLIIAFVIFILGIIAEMGGNQPLDVLGWGLVGTSGAIRFLCYVFGSIAGLVALYLFVSRGLRQQQVLHALFLRIPVLGACLRSFAIARFSWAFYLTQQAGLKILPSIDASLRATSNGAFIAQSGKICAMVEAGEDLTTALAASGLFPEDYIEIVHIGETAGTVPETLERLSPQFEEQARRSLATLAVAVGWLVWTMVAGFIIFVVVSIMLWYIGQLNEALRGIDGIT